MPTSIQGEQLSIAAETIFTFGGIEITNTLLSGVLLTLFIFIFVLFANLQIKRQGTPTKFQVFLELVYKVFYDFISKIASRKEVIDFVLPIIGTVFIYIGFANVMMFLPGLEALQVDGKSLLRTHTTDFSVTFGIAAGLIVWTHLEAIRRENLFRHLGRYFKIGPVLRSFQQGVGAGFIAIVEFFVGLLDVISEFAKSISLSLRLFGNIFAGQVLGSIVLGVFAIFLPVPLILYGIFTGLLQALVFGALTSSYFSTALET